jgi:predicted transcriptional regulator of viral defense system
MRPKTPSPKLSPSEQQFMTWARREGRTAIDLRVDASELDEFSGKPRDMLYELARKGRVHRVQAGRYLISQKASRRPRLDALDPLAAVVLRRLSHQWYLSWHSALWHYGLIDQQASRLYVALTARKRPARVGRSEVRFVTAKERKFFGWEPIEEFGQTIYMATVEKAIIDSFDQPRLAAPVPVIANAMRSAWRDGTLDAERLVADALRFNSPVLNRRLGFFMDLYEMPNTDSLALHIGRKSAVPLAPGREPEAHTTSVNSRWLVFEDPAIVGAAEQLR